MRLIAKKAFSYGGKQLNVGDAFDASSRDGKILKAVRRAEEIETADSAPLVRAPRNRAPAGRAGRMQFQAPPASPEALTTESGAGTYGRRDMRAED